MIVISVIFLCSLLSFGDFTHIHFLGCYENNPTIKLQHLTEGHSEKSCVNSCYKEYYPYALFGGGNNCACSHFIGKLTNKSHCNVFCHSCLIRDIIRDAYFTGYRALRPPINLTILNITDTQFYISWDIPEFTDGLSNYIVRANVVRSYSSIPLKGKSWYVSNSTFRYSLNNLHPGTCYNVSVRGVSEYGPEIETYQIAETKIGKLNRDPETPEIITREKTTMKIKIKPVVNDNGPINSYLIIVSNRSSAQTVNFHNLMSITKAINNGLSYYVTAEISSANLNDTFEIGNGQIYGDYYNAPLSPSTFYDILLGVESRKNDIEISSFSPPAISTSIHDIESETSTSNSLVVIVIFLICSGMFIACLLFFIAKYRIVNNDYRLHSSDNLELTLRRPAIDVENHGRTSEEISNHVDYYEELRKQVWMIPRQLLKVDYTKVIGQGKFGIIYRGTLEKDPSSRNVLVYNIADRTLKPDEKQEMLSDLRLLIKTGKHKNVLEFVGACQNLDNVCITIEYHTVTLKDYLLTSRVHSNNSYTTLNDMKILRIAISIAEGLHHLHTRNLIHKRLCARHVAIVGQHTPKIMGYGLTSYYKDNKNLNFTRWTAREVLKGGENSVKSDVWSLACLIWEICALGGTPYASTGNNEVAQKILNGCTLPKLDCMDQEFYQMLLNCWQINTDERPYAMYLQQTMGLYLSDTVRHYLNFATHKNVTFKYEQYTMELELDVVEE